MQFHEHKPRCNKTQFRTDTQFIYVCPLFQFLRVNKVAALIPVSPQPQRAYKKFTLVSLGYSIRGSMAHTHTYTHTHTHTHFGDAACWVGERCSVNIRNLFGFSLYIVRGLVICILHQIKLWGVRWRERLARHAVSTEQFRNSCRILGVSSKRNCPMGRTNWKEVGADGMILKLV